MRIATTGMTVLATVLVCTLGRTQDVAPAAPAGGTVEYAVENGALVVVQGETRTTVAADGRVESVLVSGKELYAALGERGVAVYALGDPASPKLARIVPSPGGRVTGFHVAGGEVWMEIASVSAVPVGGRGAVAKGSSQATPEVSIEAEKKEAQLRAKRIARKIGIRRMEPGKIEVDAGSADGVQVGDRLSVFHTRPVEDGGEESFVGRELVAVVEVIAVKEKSALAELGRGARVSKEDEVEPARADHESSNTYPHKLEGLAEVGATIRPLIKVGTPVGGGLLSDVFATYRGGSYFMGLRMQPLGLGWTDEGNVVSVSALVEGGYDGRAFGVGLGVGLSSVNGDMDFMLESSSVAAVDAGGKDKGQKSYSQRTRNALALSQQVRLGALDGLSLTVYNIIIYHDATSGADSGFIYGGTSGRGNIPLGTRTSLFVEGGGGVMGYGFGALGVSSWIIGNGDAGSLQLSVSAGGAAVWGSREVTQTDSEGKEYTTAQEVMVAGPMVSMGLAYRFGF
ncbi:MAG: hypothetical protein PHU25_07585 [Deltaproteobacteria bacterium]|nr:hypothetical protein [Deltaproteobacteria bacterium]